jgi:hypothetical protein
MRDEVSGRVLLDSHNTTVGFCTLLDCADFINMGNCMHLILNAHCPCILAVFLRRTQSSTWHLTLKHFC